MVVRIAIGSHQDATGVLQVDLIEQHLGEWLCVCTWWEGRRKSVMEEGKDDAMERGRDGVMEGGRDGVIERREGVREEECD